MDSFDLVNDEILRGIDGKNAGIPMGFNRLNKYISIRKRIYSVIFGATGSGKSAFIHAGYILNPFDWWIANKDKTPIKIKVILFSMERSKVYTLAKWLSRKIFLDEGVLIPIPKMLGWWDTKLTKDEHDLILQYSDYINELCEFVDIVEGAQNPTGIYKYVKNYAEANGRVEQVNEFKKIYIPNDENKIVIPIGDHFGLAKIEKGMSSKKEAIDKCSEHFQMFRDHYGMSPVAVSQMTRDKSNPIYAKLDSFEPTIDDIKESGRMAEDADNVVSLFNPLRYKTNDPVYDVNKFVDGKTGANYFRSVKILKNTYGEDDIRIGMGFMGSTGIFKELPKKDDLVDSVYERIIKNTYFLE